MATTTPSAPFNPAPRVVSAGSAGQLLGFVPARLLQVLGATGAAIESHEVRFEGAVLFADVVGFTELVQRSVHHGAEGLEQVTHLLQATFARYVDEITAAAGEVVLFAGDGLLAYWPEDSSDNTSAVRAAAACGARLLGVRVHAERVPGAPELRVGVAVGPLWAARVGTFHRGFHVVLGGAAVRAAVAAQGAAASGELAVSVEALSRLGPELKGRRRGVAFVIEPGAAVTIDAPLVAPSLAGPPPHFPLAMVPRVIEERVAERADVSRSELRRVTPLFVRIDGLDETSSEALMVLQRIWLALSDVVHAFSADVGRLLIDDKGLVFLLVFGIPYNTHADDFTRSVRLALSIERKMVSLGLRCAMGISAGQVVSGVLGTPLRREYATVGPAMNRAARLMEAAGTGLLCADEGELSGEHPDLTVVPAGALKLKGFEGELVVARVTSRRAVAVDAAPDLFGREVEQARLEARLHDLADGRGGVVAIVAEAGMGKTALVHHFVERARQRGMRCLQGQAAGEVQRPYGLFRSVFAALLGTAGEDDPARVEARVRQALAGTRHLELLPLLGAVLDVALVDNAHTEVLHGQARAAATLELAAEIVVDMAPVQLVVVLEDAHSADAPSIHLAERLCKLVPSLLLVLTSREAHAPLLDELLASVPDSERVALQPLDSAARAALVRRMLGGAPAPPGLFALVDRQSGGNALYIVECVLLLTDLERERERGLVAPETAAYDSVRAVITSRLDRLSSTEAHAVRIASVLGTGFRWSDLEMVFRELGIRLDSLMEQSLVRQRLLARDPEEKGGYRFQHQLIRDVAYELMLVQQRRALHGVVAGALEGRGSEPARPATLAHHWWMAGDLDRAVTWSDRAGSDALASGAFEEAGRHFTRCLEAAGQRQSSRQQLLSWHRKLSDAHAGVGNLVGRASVARAALALVGEEAPASGATTNLRALTALLLSPLRSSRGASAEERLELSALFRHLAHVAYFESDGPGLVVCTLAALKAAETCPPSPGLCGSLAELGGAIGLGGMDRLARRYFARAVRTAGELRAPDGAAYVHMVRGLYLVGRGEFSEASASAARCQDICELIGDSLNWGNAQIVRFWIAFYGGQLDEADAAAAALLGRAERHDNHQQVAWALRGLALVRLSGGAVAAARAHLEHAEARVPRSDIGELMPTVALRALCHARLDDQVGARTVAEEASAMAQRLGRPTGHAILVGLSALASVALLGGDGSARAQRGVIESLRRLDSYRRIFPIGAPTYWAWRGVWETKRHRERAALRSTARGVRAAARLGLQAVGDPWAPAAGHDDR